MARRRPARIAGHGLRLALFTVALVAAGNFLLDAVSRRASPAALFGLLLVAGALSLTWRATQDLRKELRRTRS